MLTRPSLHLLSAFTYRNEKLLQDPVRLRQISERIPAGRWGEPRDFAGPVVFLASAASRYVCGEILVVDGVSVSFSSRNFALRFISFHCASSARASGLSSSPFPTSSLPPFPSATSVGWGRDTVCHLGHTTGGQAVSCTQTIGKARERTPLRAELPRAAFHVQDGGALVLYLGDAVMCC